MLADNVFLKILDGTIPARIAFQDDLCLAFHDIHPQAPVHILIIPRKVIRTHAELRQEDTSLIGHMNLVAGQLARDLGLDQGYRIVINCETDGGQTVPHLHMHLLGGRSGWYLPDVVLRGFGLPCGG